MFKSRAGKQVHSTELTRESLKLSHVLATRWRWGFLSFWTQYSTPEGSASLTWVVVRRGFVQHGRVFGVRAHQRQNQSCTNISSIYKKQKSHWDAFTDLLVTAVYKCLQH